MSTLPHFTVVCALVERCGRVLVAQRAPGQSQAGKWEFPGGKCEPEESPEAALVRELREELQLDLTVGERRPATFHHYGRFAITLIPFLATVPEDCEPHPVEHAAVRWCPPQDLRGLDWAPADLPIVDDYLRQREAGPAG